MMTPDQIAFFHEENRAYRMIRLSDRHADTKSWDPAYMGEAIAKWDGDVLVIDTTNFKADGSYLDSSGLPASDRLHLVERVRLIDGGNKLEDVVTVDDPGVFSRPWTSRLVFRRRSDIEIKTDWICGEPHRDLAALRGGSK